MCYEVASQVQKVWECHTIEQTFFLPRTYVVVSLIVLSTLLILFAQYRFFRKFDLTD